MVRITASIMAKVAHGSVQSVIDSGPRINTTPADAGVSCTTADIIMKMAPIKINRKLMRKKFKERWLHCNCLHSSNIVRK